jgi:hypothetical protein
MSRLKRAEREEQQEWDQELANNIMYWIRTRD